MYRRKIQKLKQRIIMYIVQIVANILVTIIGYYAHSCIITTFGIFCIWLASIMLIKEIDTIKPLLRNKENLYEYDRIESMQRRAKMCTRSRETGVCPNACEICAWNIFREEDKK